MKKLLTFLLVLSLFSISQAVDPKKGDANKGKQIYKEVCRSCHDGTNAKKITPMNRTIAQWKRLFDNDMARLKEKHTGNEAFNKINKDDFEHLYKFIIEGALDAEQPQTCD